MILETFKLNGRVALVTGATRGLGQALAIGLAEAGADVVSLSRQEGAAETETAVTALGHRFQHICCDLMTATPELLAQHVVEVGQTMGGLDILINNAGMIRRSATIDHSEAAWDAVTQVNLKAAFFLAQAAARIMAPAGGGKIINMASVLSFEGGLFAPSYAVSKHGLVGMTRAMANEWASHGVNVNAIAPGYFATDMTRALQHNKERYDALMARIPAQRFGDPTELQGVAVFLASAASNFVHGETIAVDGGWLSR